MLRVMLLRPALPNTAVQEANAVPATPNTAVRGPLLINAVQTASINGSTGDNTIGVAVQTASSTPINAPTGNNAINGEAVHSGIRLHPHCTH
jgi:hypothetical protein